MNDWTGIENALYLLAWPLLLILSLFAMAGLLHVVGWLFDKPRECTACKGEGWHFQSEGEICMTCLGNGKEQP